MANCNFCPERSVSAHLVRVGAIPPGWTHGDAQTARKNPDKSHLQVVRVCVEHKAQVPR